MKETKSKALVYKRAHLTESEEPLKVLLQRALADKHTAGSRRESLSPSGESPVWRLVGQYQTDNEFVFGVLMRYAPGTNPLYLIDDEAAPSLTVQQMAAPETSDGKRRELIESMLFFGVTGNHLVMMQSTALRSDHLESHLLWLLRGAQKLPGTAKLLLVDQLPPEVAKKLSDKPVRRLKIAGDLLPDEVEKEAPPQNPEPPSDDALHSTNATGASQGASPIVDSLRSFMAPTESERLNIQALNGANIQYDLTLSYKYTTTTEGQKFMNSLGVALRHAEGVNTRIELVGGGIIRGSDLRLAGKVRVTYRDGVPDPSEVFTEMRRWLIERLKSGDVQA